MNELDEDRELLDEFCLEANELLEQTDESFREMRANPAALESVNSVFRAFHTIKGNSAYFGLMRIKEFTHTVEGVLDSVRNGETVAAPGLVDDLQRARDHLLELLEHAGDDSSVPVELDEELAQAVQAWTVRTLPEVMGMLRPLIDGIKQQSGTLDGEENRVLQGLFERVDKMVDSGLGTASEVEAPSGADQTKATAAASAGSAEEAGNAAVSQKRKTMRVDESKVDKFMDNVGELMNMVEIYGNILRNLEERPSETNQLNKDFKLANRNFHVIADTMQNDVMEIRQVPIRSVISKLTRIVRELARAQGKSVEVEVTGEEQLIDKSYVEVIEGPLVHMIRNAVDHGIELPKVREQQGKGPEGRIQIQYHIHKDFYELVLTDDGKGMDTERLRAKVLEKGLMRPAELAGLSDQDVLQVVFLPGFSTAEQVTEVSGRGVGMDVVLTSVQGAGGSVRLESEFGKGSTVRIQLPRSLTLVVVNGLLVEIGPTHYIIPMDNLRETIDLDEGQVSQLPGNTEVVSVRGQPLSLVRLGQRLQPGGEAAAGADPQRARQAVVVAHKSHSAVLEVDRALGLQKVVVKRIDDDLLCSKFVRGGAVLGDGTVGLILNVGALI